MANDGRGGEKPGKRELPAEITKALAIKIKPRTRPRLSVKLRVDPKLLKD